MQRPLVRHAAMQANRFKRTIAEAKPAICQRNHGLIVVRKLAIQACDKILRHGLAI